MFTCHLLIWSSTFFYLQDLSNIFQYDFNDTFKRDFFIRLFEAFCIRLIAYTCSAYVFRNRGHTSFEIARHLLGFISSAACFFDLRIRTEYSEHVNSFIDTY